MYTFNTILTNNKNISNFYFNSAITGDNVQGSCGSLNITIDKITTDENTIQNCRDLICKESMTDKLFYKYGNTGNNCTLARLEYVIAQHLMQECAHLPNFLRACLYIKNKIIRNAKKNQDPFSLKNVSEKNYKIVDICLFEYLNSTITFGSFFKKNKNIDIFNSLSLQTLFAVHVAQRNCKFTHNDLHASNIVITPCDKNIYFLYRLKISNVEKTFLINSFGHFPIIIDYGYSYSSECEQMSLEIADYDNYGFITYQHDEMSDYLRFLTVLQGININPTLSAKIINLLSEVPVSLKNSWERIVTTDSCQTVHKKFKKIYSKYYDISIEQEYTFMKQFEKLALRAILLPLNYNAKYKNVNLTQSINDFLFLWQNIDKWIKFIYQKTLLARTFFDTLRHYIKKRNISDDELAYSIKTLNKELLQITKNSIPVSVDWRKLILSAIDFVGSAQNNIYINTQNLHKKRHELIYNKLVSGDNVLLNVIDTLYTVSAQNIFKNSKIIVIDNILKSNTIVEINENVTHTAESLFKYIN